MNNTLTKSELTYLKLREIYESYGFKRFAMRKFEEYSLYLENKNFLTSEYILTFNDPSGRLMALKPDVTLSILKNTKTNARSERVYYRENVCRLDKGSMEYREIEQLGLEMTDSVTGASLVEICDLAAVSLATVDSEYILCISDMDFIVGMFDSFSLSEEQRASVTNFIRSKSAHELIDALKEYGVDGDYAVSFAGLLSSAAENSVILGMAEKLSRNEMMRNALARLNSILTGTGYPERLSVDLTLMNDTAYYNGLIFAGYVRRIPRAVLSGGCYDKLALKFGKHGGAVGFALNLGELNASYDEKHDYDVDIMLICGQVKNDMNEVLRRARELRAQGKSVRVESCLPEGIRYGEIIYFGEDAENA